MASVFVLEDLNWTSIGCSTKIFTNTVEPVHKHGVGPAKSYAYSDRDDDDMVGYAYMQYAFIKVQLYLKSLEKINEEKGMRKQKAYQLLDRYQKICSSLNHKTSVKAQVTSSVTCCLKNPRPDYKIAKAWKNKFGTINEQENPLLRRTPRKINKINYAENSKRVCNEIYDEDDNKSDNDNGKDKKTKEKKKLEKKLIDDFILRYKVINTDNKWKLPSERFIEDILYDWAIIYHFETVIKWEQGVNTLADDNLEGWIVIDRMKLLKLMKDMLDLINKSLLPTTVENYRSLCTFGIQLFKNKGIIYIMNHFREAKKTNLEAPMYIEGLCNLILSIITMLELKNAIWEIFKIIKKVENNELEAQVFRKNNTEVQLSFTVTTPTPRYFL
ncbi:hypothetical protein Glove_86g108 [Diversispora epigaea]|uniref:Uncharacterized protein n=1 Tax=Diversispora epigaea TaxID=1348612 RepID=A0A397JG91_9GLOM|nr:hypothetical protein Glove_86g108 [Diversispora epigaea]